MHIELKGKKFNRLLVVDYIYTNKHKKAVWLCRCDCGNLTNVITSKLIGRYTKSCGCYSRDLTIKRNTTHNFSKTRFYKIWSDMNKRCNNKNTWAYKYYGGRGIKVSQFWNNFMNFKIDMYFTYLSHLKKFGKLNTTLERINNNKGYGKDNCKWATRKEQSKNRTFRTSKVCS